MKKTILTLLCITIYTFIVNAQTTNLPSTFIKGDLSIVYNTHQNPPGTKGIQDNYEININVDNSVIFHGKMTDRPQIIDGWITKSIVQPRSLKYDVACDVVNPRNIAQTKNIGSMHGFVPISSDGVYNYDKGNLVMDILPIGRYAGGFTDKFKGQAAGKPLIRPANWTDTIREAVNIDRLINGKPTRIILKRYDKMEFQQLILAEGPVEIYQPITVNGTMLYDYDKNCWFFNNFGISYISGENIKNDRIAGTIRWIEDPQRKSNGLGHYEFDIRVNEPIIDNNAAFSPPSDESAFFSNDTSISGLTGNMNYKDTLNANGDTLSSAVTIDLKGNNITKQQLMALAKIVIFIDVIPMNSD